MAVLSFEKFCGSPFWDTNLTWNTENPSFTPCFEKTVLAWIPVVFLIVFSIFDIYFIVISKTGTIPWSRRNISKMVILSLLTLACTSEFSYTLKNWIQGATIIAVDLFTPLIKLVALISIIILTSYHRKKGIRSSGLLFLYWFLAVLCGTPQFYTVIKILKSGDVDLMYVTYIIYYSGACLSLFLNCLADIEPTYSQLSDQEKPCPEYSSSFLSRIYFSWCDGLVYNGFKKSLEYNDLWDLNFEDSAKVIGCNFDKHWIHSQSRKRGKKVSILSALFKAFGISFFFGCLLKFVYDFLLFVSPQLLKLLIDFVGGNEPKWRGYLYAALLLVVASVQTLISNVFFKQMLQLGLRIRTAIISAVYRKALRLSNNARKESTVGEIVNLVSVDAERLRDLMPFLNLLWSGPLQIILSIYFLWQTLGPSVLAGVAVIIVMIPINGVVAKKLQSFQEKQMACKDERVKMMNEILSGIKVLKLYAWESIFENQVLKIRDKETKILKRMAYYNSLSSFLWAWAPFLVSIVSFATFVLVDKNNVLDAKKAFVSLALFNILSFSLVVLPIMITDTVQAWVSIKRISKFMNSEELDPDAVNHDENYSEPLVMENGTFNWGDENFILKNITMRVKENSIVAVVGSVGSGKSSLLSAFLGEMVKTSGIVNTKGSIAYVSQVSWIQNATLRDNILFGKPFNRKLYNKVIAACALEQDLQMLPGGDLTEIGEKGINLSGGQKQRVSLARAVYYNSDIYFFDDPLSAVDSHVGKHIFEQVLGPNGILHDKTRLLVTHSVKFLPDVDNIVVLKDGTISEMGTYDELLDKQEAFATFLNTHLVGDDDSDSINSNEISAGDRAELQLRYRKNTVNSCSSDTGSVLLRQLPSSNMSDKQIPGVNDRLIDDEYAEIGKVKWSVYKHYFKSIGPCLAIATVTSIFLCEAFTVGSSIWLSVWSSDNSLIINGTQDMSKLDMYLEVYSAIGLGKCLTLFLGELGARVGAWGAACKLHNTLLSNILKTPLSFTDTTPTGRILTRFSNDIDTADNSLTWTFHEAITCIFSVLATTLVISYTTPIFVSVLIPIVFVYFFTQLFYIATSRQLKRLASISNSPIFSHFGESITGSSTIRAYGVTSRFIQESEEKVDFNQSCVYPGIIANRWLAVRLESVGNFVIFFAALFAILSNDMTKGLIGLSVTYSLEITNVLNWLVRITAQIEINMVAVERIKGYSEAPQEAPREIIPDIAGEDWPSSGTVELRDYKVRYREGLDLVLKGISIKINAGEKIGIVGRTGAGKSSLTLGIFRIIEAAAGKIFIDDVDISKLGLYSLRSRITIIPQDPALFTGTVRFNLDPSDNFSDDQIWNALEMAHLKTHVTTLPDKLQYEVSEGGSNFSVGQRQLICLARALLRKTKILVLDEATAAVDLETDDLIQKTIRTEFSSCTVLTIAHRINTIMDSDRVLVLVDGLASEFDTPDTLLKNEQSDFYSLANDAGLVN